MAFNWTSLINCEGNNYFFTSQGSGTSFSFRKESVDGTFFPANPPDYINQAPRYRGSSVSTIGGSRVIQMFGQFANDSEITFSSYISEAELNDLIAAKATGYSWTLTDYFGHSYTVKFDFTAGIVVRQKLIGNDVFIVEFKFLRET